MGQPIAGELVRGWATVQGLSKPLLFPYQEGIPSIILQQVLYTPALLEQMGLPIAGERTQTGN